MTHRHERKQKSIQEAKTAFGKRPHGFNYFILNTFNTHISPIQAYLSLAVTPVRQQRANVIFMFGISV